MRGSHPRVGSGADGAREVGDIAHLGHGVDPDPPVVKARVGIGLIDWSLSVDSTIARTHQRHRVPRCGRPRRPSSPGPETFQTRPTWWSESFDHLASNIPTISSQFRWSSASAFVPKRLNPETPEFWMTLKKAVAQSRKM